MKICEEGMFNLMESILERAKQDYILLRKYHRNTKIGIGSRTEINRFLRSDYGTMFLGGDVNPEDVISNWKLQATYEAWRDKLECKECKECENCVHHESHYTAKWECKKEDNET